MEASLSRHCPSDETVAGLVDGMLTGDALASCEAHIADCSDCRRVLCEMVHVSQHPSSDAVASAGAELAAMALPVLAPVPQDRYTIEGEVARGGMGRILRGWDEFHHRRVALKVLLRSGTEASWRFVREVAITARLQHPSIVPLYEAGRWTDGEPFFAMKLVEGRSLSLAIAQTAALKERLAFVPNLVAALEALAYAHAQGIVHRDLKPSNVLLGAYGETVVIDWGLAKAVDEAARGPAANDNAPPRERDPNATDEDSPARAETTVAGSALGTPSYMPPEQARGEPVDARADVYSLGAMLYHLFAGNAPYRGKTSREILMQLLEGPPEPLAARVPELAPDLAAIVDKAMARNPSDRYPSAEQMAADLKRFTAGQLVSAHTYSVTERAGRWVRRRRAVVATASAFAVALLITGGVSVRRVVRERDRADAAKTVAERERATAVTQRDAAERLVQFAIGQLRDRLAPLGKLDLLGGLGAEVDGYYRSVAPTDDALDTPALKRRGAAIEMLSGVELAKHNLDVAGALAGTQKAIYQRILARDANDLEARLGLADADIMSARAAWDKDDRDGALDLARSAARTAQEALTRAPQDEPAHITHAAANAKVAFFLAERGDKTGAREAGEAALADLANLGAGEHLEARWQDRLGAALGDVARSRWAVVDEYGALDLYRRIVDVNERLARATPSDANRVFALARSRFDLASREYQSAIFDDATLTAAIDAFRSLVPLDPANREWRGTLSYALAQQCDEHRARHRLDPARAACREALDVGRRLRESGETDARMDKNFEYATRVAGEVELDAGRMSEGLAFMQQALAMDEEALGKDPGNRSAMMSDLSIREHIADVEMGRHRPDAAAAAIDAGVQLTERYPATGKEVWHEKYFAASLLSRRATILAVRGDRAGAERTFRQVLDDFTQLMALVPSYDDVKKGLTTAAVGLAALLRDDRGGREEARALTQRAVDVLQPMHDNGTIGNQEDLLRRAKALLGH
jgi:tetratricopeptide (TPR) repeat protein